MDPIKKDIKNLADAFEYVNSHYIFNSTNYPGFNDLSPDQQIAFAINHSIYHIVKNLSSLRRREGSGFDLRDALYKAAAIKMLVNLIKLAEVLGITKDSFVAIEPAPYDSYDSQMPLGYLVEDFLRDFATKLEAADHSGKHNTATLRAILEDYWSKILSAVSLFPQDAEFKLVDAYALFPEYMKSK